MIIWLAVSLILAVVAIYLFVIELFSVALKLTGLATSKIRFQVASLFTGTGFTTSESELIVNDERRRKIAVACSYTGHVFSVVIMGLVINVFVTIALSILQSGDASSLFSFVIPDVRSWYFIFFCVSFGLFLCTVLIKIPPINKRFQKLLENIAINISKKKRESNIITVLDYYGKSAIVEVILNKLPDFANEVSLGKMGLTKKYSFILLSIRRGNRRVSVSKDTMLAKGDVIVAYGHINDIREAFVNSVAGKKGEALVVDKTNDMQLLNNYGANTLMEINVNEVPKELDGIPMKDSHLTDRYNINIVIIKRNDEYLFANAETIIQKGDLITLFGPYINIKHLFKNDDE